MDYLCWITWIYIQKIFWIIVNLDLIKWQSKIRYQGKWFQEKNYVGMTWNFVNEVLRNTPIVQGVFREAIEDFTYEDFHIPKEWKVYIFSSLFKKICHIWNFQKRLIYSSMSSDKSLVYLCHFRLKKKLIYVITCKLNIFFSFAKPSLHVVNYDSATSLIKIIF